jgi:hypothetical protein
MLVGFYLIITWCREREVCRLLLATSERNKDSEDLKSVEEWDD